MKHLLAAIIGLIFLYKAGAQPKDVDLQHSIWKAKWITPPGINLQGYLVFHARTKINLAEKPSKFMVHVSADNRYKLYVNGQFVSLGPGRSDPRHWYYETVDLAPFLTAGDNSIAALVWNFGDQKPVAQMSRMTGFVLQAGEAADARVNTGSNWKTLVNTAYSALAPELVYSYYVAGPGEKINYRDMPTGWEQTSYDDSGWKPAQTVSNAVPKGVFDWSDTWMLYPSPIPAMEIKKQLYGTVRQSGAGVNSSNLISQQSPTIIAAHTKTKILVDQGFYTNAYPVVQWTGGKNAVISLSYAESLYTKDGPDNNWRAQTRKGNRNEVEGKRFVGVKDELIAGGGKAERFESLSYRTFRYVLLNIETQEEALQIDSFYNKFTGYPFTLQAHVETGDTLHQKMMEIGWRTARSCAVETYMDCPYYEQLQYMGDARIQAMISLYNTTDDRLVRNCLRQLDWSRMAEGITLSRYPTGLDQQIPSFSLWWIGAIHDYWLYRDDPAFVKSLLPGIRQVLSFYKNYQLPDGRVQNAPYWMFTDWTSAPGWSGGVAPLGSDHCSATIDFTLLYAYQLAASLEDSLGVPALASGYKQEAARLKAALRKNYWDAGKKWYADDIEHKYYSQHTNTLSILTGINSRQEDIDLGKRLDKDSSLAQATIYFLYYVNQALNKAGRGNEYLDQLGIWKKDLELGLTTWAEMSDVDGSRSDCHAWGASPNIEFFRVVLGIDAAKPGFKEVRIAPQPGKIKKLSGSMPHPKGMIEVKYEIDEKGALSGYVILPPNTTGSFTWKGKTRRLQPGKNILR